MLEDNSNALVRPAQLPAASNDLDKSRGRSVFARRLVRLQAGEEQPIGRFVPLPDGYREENNQEFADRLFALAQTVKGEGR